MDYEQFKNHLLDLDNELNEDSAKEVFAELTKGMEILEVKKVREGSYWWNKLASYLSESSRNEYVFAYVSLAYDHDGMSLCAQDMPYELLFIKKGGKDLYTLTKAIKIMKERKQ